MRRAPQERDAYVEYFVRVFRMIGSPRLPGGRGAHARAGRPRRTTAATTPPARRASSRRSWPPARGPRRCGELDVPTVVVHGKDDPLVPFRARRSHRPKRSPAPSSSRSPGWGTTCRASCGRGSRTRWWRTRSERRRASRRGARAPARARAPAWRRRARRRPALSRAAYSASSASRTCSQLVPGALRLHGAGDLRRQAKPSASYTGRSTSLIRPSPLTTSTTPVCDPPATTRWPMPASFDGAAGVHAVAAGAVLAGHLPHPCVQAERARARASRPAVRSKRSWIPARGSCAGTACPISIVPSWKTAARPPARRSVASNPCARAPAHGLREAVGHRVALRECDGGAWPGDS